MHLYSWLLDVHPAQLGSDASGYVASALVLLTFCMNSMRPLRMVAIASNVAFIAYAMTAHLYPVLILHSILLPLNVTRLLQIELGRGFLMAHLPGRRSSSALAGRGHNRESRFHASTVAVAK
jgi:hypothetical protein